MSDQEPTVAEYLAKARSRLEHRTEPATVGDVAMAQIAVLSLHEAVRKLALAMERQRVMTPGSPEMKEVNDLLLQSFRTSMLGISDITHRLTGGRDG